MEARRVENGSWLDRVGVVCACLWLFGLVMMLELLALGSSRWLRMYVLTSVLALGFAWLAGRGSTTKRWFVRAGTGAAFLLIWAVFFTLGPERAELEREGDAIIAALEGYRAEHARFPESLSEAGFEPRWNRFGAWQYRADGAAYVLGIGDYCLDGFVLCRVRGGWQWDT